MPSLGHTVKHNFPKENLIQGSFGCDASPMQPDNVPIAIARTLSLEYNNFNATQLIQDWMTSEPKIKLDGLVHNKSGYTGIAAAPRS